MNKQPQQKSKAVTTQHLSNPILAKQSQNNSGAAGHGLRSGLSVSEILLRLSHVRATYLSAARKAAMKIAAGSIDGTVTIDDVRDVCPPPNNIDPRVMGAVFMEKGVWQKLGWENSVRPACHHRPIQRFKLIK